MNQLPLVSVIVCTYNQENYLSDALDSILSQITDFPFEIILSDDCSSDGTSALCREYASRYPEIIRYFKNEFNKGIVRNYYDSIRLSNGKYIADLAGDDIWVDRHKLAEQVKIMESDSSIVLCHTAWRKFRDDGSIFEPEEYFNSSVPVVNEGKDLLPFLLRHEKERYFVHLCSSLYRRAEVVELMDCYPQLFDNEKLPCEDFQLIVMLADKGKIAYIPSYTLHYRVGQVSLSSTEDSRKVVLFVCGVINLTIMLCDILCVDRKEISGYCRFNLQYALMQAFLGDNMSARDIIAEYAKQLKPISGISFKTKVILFLTSNRLLWKMSGCLYQWFGKF